MYELNSIIENQRINKLIANFIRSPLQTNNPHDSDAEIIKLNDSGSTLLAVTTDSICEEILTGLYEDPYLIGRMIVTVNMSDLAAVGASPLGILISEIIPTKIEQEKINDIQRGIADACRDYLTFVLGGDTNEGDKIILTGTAIGIIKERNPVSRKGCNPSDVLYSSGKLGSGNAYAISKLISKKHTFKNYNPVARLNFIKLLNKYASSCMDTSDGLIATLDQLSRLNNVGFEIKAGWQNAIEDNALNYSRKNNIPAWLLFAGQHGEFELIFTVPINSNEDFLEAAIKNGFNPIDIGKVISDKELRLPIYNDLISINTTLIRNLPFEVNGDTRHYLNALLEYDRQIRRELS